LKKARIFKDMAEKHPQMAVIFDLDGVLVDTGLFHKQSWYDLAEREAFEMTDGIFYATFGMQNYQIIPMLVGRELPRDEIDRMSDWKEQRYRELIAGKLKLLPGAKMLIDDLKKSGFLLAVGTSAPKENLDFMLDNTSLHNSFDAYVTGEEVTNGKPAPETFLKAAQKLAVAASNCVVVEDAVHGVQAAKAAKMAVIAVTTTRKRSELTKADMIVENLSQINAGDFIKLLSHQKSN
jgi:beta-phosphoglucomutase